MKPTIQDLQELNPIRMNDWNIIFTKFPDGVDAGPLAPADFNLRARSTGLPETTISPMEVNIRGLRVRIPGDGTPNGEFNVTLVESVDQKVIDFLRNWRVAAFNPETGERKAPKELRGEMLITLLAPDLKPIRRFRLFSVWPSNVTLGELQGDPDAGPMEVTITFSFDWYKEEPVGGGAY